MSSLLYGLRSRPAARASMLGKSALASGGMVALAAMLAAPAPATAQALDTIFEEITVTAQFREQRLQDTPLAITAVTDDMMRARAQTSIYEVTQQAPNVEIKRNSGPFGSSTSAFIRGVGQGDFNFAFEPGVGMYIDDVYFPTMTGSAFEIIDLERIEILRGPQGTLQGRNAIGGAVRLISRKPTGEGGGYAEATTGSRGRIGGRAAGEFAISETLAARITLAGNSENGYVDRLDFACDQPATAATLGIVSSGVGRVGCKIGTLGGQSYMAGRATVRWNPTEKLEFNLIGDLTNDNSEATAMVLLIAPQLASVPPTGTVSPAYGPWFETPAGSYTSYETFADPTATYTGMPYSTPPINHLYAWGLALTADYEINENLAIKSITSYRELENNFSTAHDGSPLNGETGYNELFGHSFQEEIRLNGTAGPVDYTVGGFYFEQTNTNRNRIDIGYLPFPFDFISEEIADSRSWALFGHAVWHVTDRLNATGGLRYSDEKKTQVLGRLDPIDGGLSPSQLGAFAELLPTGYAQNVPPFVDDRIDYRISLDYRWADSFMTYLTHATGYKSAGISPRFFFASHILPFGVEEAQSYEAGFKADLLDNSLRINGAVFRTDYKDQQTGAPGSTCPDLTPSAPCLAIGNYVDSRFWGAELEANWRPTSNTLVDLSGSYIAAKYTRGHVALKTSNPNFIDNPDGPPGIPQWKFSAGVQHTFDIGNAGNVTPRVDVNYESSRDPNDARLLVTPGFTVVNARMTWRSADEDWEAAVGVTNLTDKYYFHNIFDIRNFGGWAAAQPAEPREWYLTVRRSF